MKRKINPGRREKTSGGSPYTAAAAALRGLEKICMCVYWLSKRLRLRALTLPLLLLCGCGQPEQPHTSVWFAMDTVIEQRWYGPRKEELAEEVRAALAELEQCASLYLPDSEIARLSASAGIAPEPVSEMAMDLLSQAQALSAQSMQSGGGFDLTIGPVTQAWGVTSEHPRVPEEELLAEKLGLVDWRDLHLDRERGEAILMRAGQSVDLGAVAKGYACDLIAEIANRYPGAYGYVNVGSSVFCLGRKRDGSAWRFGIRDPNGLPEEYLGTVELPWAEPETGSLYSILSTSGTYERYFIEDCEKYHHIIDAKTGKPVQNSLLSVTVVCYNGLMSDYLSTDLLIRGREGVLENLDNKDFGVIAVDDAGTVYVSDHLRGMFQLNGQKQAYKLYEKD